jgi:glutathionyl-hydroquinone reductase
MGALVDGVWRSEDVWKRERGRFVREVSQFRDAIDQDDGQFPFAPGRYHLYVSYACPWAHRTLIVRELRGLTEAIGVSSVEAVFENDGWEFSERCPDNGHQSRFAYELYQRANPNYTGRVTVPILWDLEREAIVNNESSEIIRMFNRMEGTGSCPDLFPAELRGAIDEVNARIYFTLNNGVYRAGFATTQNAYEEAVTQVFSTLEWLEQHLEGREFLVGSQLTEADVRLFPTLIRFDSIYYGHFKCGLRRIADFPNLNRYLRGLYQRSAFQETTRIEEAKRHYYCSHRSINPTGIVPLGPRLSWDTK